MKNPTRFKDEFWEIFVGCWIVGFAMISQFVFVFMPGNTADILVNTSGQYLKFAVNFSKIFFL
jgi:hypothetical protein